jgi:hypothetical protein
MLIQDADKSPESSGKPEPKEGQLITFSFLDMSGAVKSNLVDRLLGRIIVVNKKAVIIIVVISVLLLGASYRFVQLLPYPIGGGQFRESTDKRYTAHASSMTNRYYWGGERRYYEFIIEAGPRQRIRRIVIDEPPEGMIDWRNEGTIQWAADSSAVTFIFNGTRLIMSTKP